MKSKSPPNAISALRSLSDFRKNAVEDGEGKPLRHEPAPAGPADASDTDLVLGTRSHSCKQIVCDARDLEKRKYEDMTSFRTGVVKAGNDHEISTTVRFFREHKKRKPPDGSDVLQVHDAVQVEGGARGVDDQLAARTSDSSTRRSRSASWVLEITPEICGESDLTAENHMAEESSRSSNNDASSTIFENAAESVSDRSSREFRSTVSGLGVMHCLINHTNGDRSDVTMPPSNDGLSKHMNRPLGKSDGHDHVTHTQMKDARDREGGVPKSEPAANQQLGSGSTETPSSVTASTVPSQLWGRSNQEWLQLGLGASTNLQLEPAFGIEGKPSLAAASGQDKEKKTFFKQKILTQSIDFSVAVADCEAHSGGIPGNSPATPAAEWQLRRGSSAMPPKCEESSCDPSVNLNPATFRSVPLLTSQVKNAGASELQQGNLGQPDLCIFGRRLIQTGLARQELVLAPFSFSGATQSFSGLSEKFERGVTSIDPSFELRRDQGGCSQGVMFPDQRDERFDNTTMMRMSEIHSRVGPSLSPMSMPVPIADAHRRLAQTASTNHDASVQYYMDYPPSSLSALQQRRDDLRLGQVEYSWLRPPAAVGDQAPKLIPTANNFQGWTGSSEMASTTKVGAMSGYNATSDIPLSDQQQQATRGADEWGSLFRKVGPKMMFKSQCHIPEGSSVLVQPAGHDTSAGSQENLVALKRAIDDIQKRPSQWPIPPDARNFSMGSWGLSGNSLGIRGDCSSTMERPLMSTSFLSENVPVHPRFASDHLNLSDKQQHRQSWQPAGAGHAKLHHGNVNTQRQSESASRPKFQVFPPGSRGPNHAGLWFILQSAENQSGEGGLPQISKAYLRIKDGKMPVSAVKKYLVSKLGLASESEVEITCKGQPVVPSLPLQHVRDVIWFSNLNANNSKEQTSSGEREESATSASDQRDNRPPAPASDRGTAPAAGLFSKDIIMVLTYRRHPRTLQLSSLLA